MTQTLVVKAKLVVLALMLALSMAVTLTVVPASPAYAEECHNCTFTQEDGDGWLIWSP